MCNMISWVEHYQPKFFLLENVVGLTRFPLQCQQVDNALKGGIQMGVVKFILRSLVALGQVFLYFQSSSEFLALTSLSNRYQCHFKILYANQYGSPQGRARVIFWGARRDVILPKFPIPTHTIHAARFPHRVNLPSLDILLPTTRQRDVDEDSTLR